MTKKDKFIMLGLGVLSFVFYALFSNIFTVTSPVEVNYALSAKEMVLNNSYISPMIFGNYWYDKPPLTYWGLMAAYKMFGFTNFAARFPALIVSSACVMAMFAAAKALTKNRHIAIWSSIVLVTMFEFWYIGHAVITDGYLFLGSIGIFAFSYLAFTEHSKKHIILAYASAGFAVLAKGPVGIVLPGLVLVAFLLVRRQKEDLKILFNPIGILTFFVIATPWYIAMYNIHGFDFIAGFLGLHNYIRATVSEHPEVNVWYYYIMLMPVFTLPWTGVIFNEWYHDFKNKLYKTDELRIFSWLWFIAVMTFYTLVATKYVTYTFISLIPLALMTAQGVNRLIETPSSKAKQWWICFSALIFFVGLLTIASYIEIHINPALMTLIFGVVMVSLLAAIKTVKVKNFPVVTAACAFLVLLALAPTIVPVLNIRSAEGYSKQVEAFHPNQVYYYHDYDTSYTFYTGRVPLRIIDPVNLPYSVWEKGKNVMPSEMLADFEKADKPAPRSIFIVKTRYLKYFYESPISKHFHPIAQYDRFIFFGNFDAPAIKIDYDYRQQF